MRERKRREGVIEGENGKEENEERQQKKEFDKEVCVCVCSEGSVRQC